MQVDPRLTPSDCSWFQRLKLKYDEALSRFAFDFNSRRYSMVLFLNLYKPAQAEVRPDR